MDEDLRELALHFLDASPRSNRSQVCELVLSGTPLNIIRSMDKNYPPWVCVLESAREGRMSEALSNTNLRRVERGLSDLLTRPLPRRLKRSTAFALREVRDFSMIYDDQNFVYAFTSPARQGVRVGQTSRGAQRLRSHVNVYGEIQPVGMFTPPLPWTPLQLEKLMLEDLSAFRDDRNQDWHLVDGEVVVDLALNLGATFTVNSDKIWARATR